MALVVKKWYAEATPNEQGEYVRIFARRQGLLAWFLSLIRLDPTVYFGVYRDQIEFRISNLSGYVKEVAPISSITSCGYGYYRPWKASLALFVLFACMALVLAKIGYAEWGLAVAVIGEGFSAAYYLLKRELGFSVTLHSDDTYGLMGVRRSIIENQEIDERSFEKVVAILSSILRQQHQGV